MEGTVSILRRSISRKSFRALSESSSKPKPQDDEMAVAFRDSWFDNNHSLFPRHREGPSRPSLFDDDYWDSLWARDDWLDRMEDWPRDWPRPREMMSRADRSMEEYVQFFRDNERLEDWPRDWPRMDAVMPKFTSHLDRLDNNWRQDPFWKDLYPNWAQPLFKEGIDVNSSITNDDRRFAVAIDCYQFRPEEIQVKTLDDTLLVEGRHEEARDRDNFTKMYFVRKYQLPNDIDPQEISSNIDSGWVEKDALKPQNRTDLESTEKNRVAQCGLRKGRLTVEAAKRPQALTGRERLVPIEGSNGLSPSSGARNYSPVQIDTSSHLGRHHEEDRYRNEYRSSSRQEYNGGSGGYGGRTVEVPIHREGVANRQYGDSLLYRDAELADRAAGNQHSESYYRHESRNNLSPHQVTASNENRAYTNGGGARRTSFDTNGFRSHSASRGAAESQRHESSYQSGYQGGYQNGYHHDSSSSRNGGYRVDSPASTSTGILKRTEDLPPRSESRSESVRSVKIVRTYN
ncbi:unnamed protein product, partial [Mesorhabditis spiculigera]